MLFSIVGTQRARVATVAVDDHQRIQGADAAECKRWKKEERKKMSFDGEIHIRWIVADGFGKFKEG